MFFIISVLLIFVITVVVIAGVIIYVTYTLSLEENIVLKFLARGTFLEERQDALEEMLDLEEPETLEFIPEPENPHDPNAIKIISPSVGHIGYVPRELTHEFEQLKIERVKYEVWYGEELSPTQYPNDKLDDDRLYLEIKIY